MLSRIPRRKDTGGTAECINGQARIIGNADIAELRADTCLDQRVFGKAVAVFHNITVKADVVK